MRNRGSGSTGTTIPLSGAWGSRKRWRAWPCSWPPTSRRTSQVRSWWWMVATWPDSPAVTDNPAGPNLTGRVALVTGGNRGIGRAAALGLARAGADVAIAARDAAAGAEVSRDIKALRRHFEFLRCDVRSPEEVEATTTAVVERFGGLDILVTSAGVAPPETPAEDTSEYEWARIL